MAAPRLRLRRGTVDPQTLVGAGQTFGINPAFVGEPVFTDTNPTYVGLGPTVTSSGTGDFYIADSGSTFVHIGGSSYTQRVDSFLVDQVPTDNPGNSAGAKLVFEEGGPAPQTITIQAPVQDDATNSYTMLLPGGAPATAGQYLIEYDQATSQLSFVDQVASEQLTTRQAPEDTDATADVYYPTFVARNNTSPGQLETFYTEGQLTFLPDKDGNAAGTISSLDIVGEYVASTGYFSGTGSTDTTSVTTNFATEPTASGNTKAVNVGTGAAAGSTTNVNIGSVEGGTTTINSSTIVGAAATQNLFNTTATTVNAFGAATNIDIGAATGTMSINNAIVDLDGVLNVDGGDITTNQTAFNLLNTNATTVNAFGAATTVEIGSTANTSVTNINGTTANTLGILNGALVVDGGASVVGNTTIGGDLAVEGGDIIADPDNLGNAVALFDTSTGSVNVAGASGTLNLGNDGTSATTVNIATGITAAASTKTVNIATNGAANSTTNVNIGSASEPEQTTVTIFGNLTVQGTQTVTNINTTNTNITDRLLGLSNGATSAAQDQDSGLIIERGTTGDNVFIGFDEDLDLFVTGTTTSTSADTTAGTIIPVTFLAGQLNITDTAGANESVIRYFTAVDANTELGVSDAVAERYIHNVVIDGGVF